MFISYAQNFEDVMLNRLFKDKEKGFYIDIGACHPLHDSVTKAFYNRGWFGINIEPVQSFFELLQQDRKNDINLNIAISDTPTQLNFFELEGTGFSTLDGEKAHQLAQEKGLHLREYSVTTKTLAEICQTYVNLPIDFLKIDVEGWEEAVILGHDWHNFRPTVILVEATVPGEPTRKPTNIPHLLAEKGYIHVYFDGLNDYYLAQESEHLQSYFETPPNVFDDFISYQLQELQELRNHIENLEEILQARDLEISNAQKEIQEVTEVIHIKEKDTFQLTEMVANQETDIQQLNYILKDKTTEIESLKTAISQKDRDIEQLNHMIQEKEKEIVTVTTMVKEMEANIQQLHQMIAEKEADLQTLTQVVKQQEDNLHQLQEILQGKDTEIERLTALTESYLSQISILRNCLEDEKFEVKCLRKELEKLINFKKEYLERMNNLEQEMEREKLKSYQTREILKQVQDNYQGKLSESLAHFSQHDHQSSALQQQLIQALERIEAMESSKFWKLRTAWFRIRKSLGIQGD